MEKRFAVLATGEDLGVWSQDAVQVVVNELHNLFLVCFVLNSDCWRRRLGYAGVFAMFYIRERRVWIWVKDGAQGAEALMAMSTKRKTLDFEREYDDLKTKLPQTA